MKILKWISNNFLFILSLFLLAFIPLYPKIPLVDIKNTWVYVRVEDFLVTFAVLSWVVLVLFRRATLKTPLTLPILFFWLIGGLSTLNGVLLIFPTLSNVFANVAFLSMLRRMEYLSLFFVAFAGIKDKKAIFYIVWTLAIVLLLVVGYGFGQKFLSFPAYLTMNEEFSKGIPIHLSFLSRVPSTFAGHYDLAAYLVLVTPILTSLIFGFKNLLAKLFFLISSVLGFVLLFMTVSRVSFFVLLVSLVMLLILQKKRWFIGSLFVIALIFLSFAPSLLARFGNTLKEVNVLVEATTGRAIGQVKEVRSSYFENKIVKRQRIATQDAKLASASAILPFSLIPDPTELLTESNSPTGENLPQGTGYINLPLSTVIKRTSQYFYEKANTSASKEPEVLIIYGDFLIKKTVAYDLSFTTRFQGEWPRTFTAFKSNIFLGSGYGSVSLAVDNNYLRILGESGLFGFLSFFSIFLIAVIYIKKLLPVVTSSVVRSFVIGFVAGSFGLALNAILIDVFEASKVAFTLWLLMGMNLGILHLYKKAELDLTLEFKRAITSTTAVIIYLFVVAMAFFAISNYFFVGDDFTWFRWITDPSSSIPGYFTDANGFFYRPGTKLYFSLMYSGFWLNQAAYHFVSIFLHFAVSVLVFLIAKRILKNYFLSAAAGLIFLTLSGYHEAVFWISSTGFLFNAFFALLSILSFIYWKERKKKIYFVISIVSVVLSLFFHELGVVVPLLIVAYDLVFGESRKIFKKIYLYILSPLLPYLILRLVANSHWFSGDYSYSLIHLPFNFIGNIIGYLALGFLGPKSMPFYETLRDFAKGHIILAGFASLTIVFIVFVLYRLVKKVSNEEKKVIVFASLFFLLSLLPFLGLGNIASRYSYLSSFGIVLFLILILKKVYTYLLVNGKNIAISSLTLIVIVFVSFQLFQLQKIHSDWQEAGEKSKRLFIALDQIYADSWKEEPVQFHFVDVPIRNGEAWVFPVGLPDAVWFAYKNKNVSVYTEKSLDEALDLASGSPNSRVFQFIDNGGGLQEVIRIRQSITVKKII